MSQRRPLIAGNWKMNGLVAGGRELATAVASWLAERGPGGVDTVLCPPFTLLSELAGLFPTLSLGAQDCHWDLSGAHTGDISAVMLKDVGCDHVILGHSERRADHAETDDLIRRKVQAAQAAGLTAIVCVGETEAERSADRTFEVIGAQIADSVPRSSTAFNTVIAYEPVWAIGTGKVATPLQAQEVHAFIRTVLDRHLGGDLARSMRILYGGSMKPDNAPALLALPDVDGGLIGGAALNAQDFTAIIQSAENAV